MRKVTNLNDVETKLKLKVLGKNQLTKLKGGILTDMDVDCS